MSMLSSMTDRLRTTAHKVERTAKYAADWRNSVVLGDAARELRDAADTIDYLRNTCNDLQRDNEKLKQLVRDMWHDGMCDCDERGVCSEYGVCAKCEYGYPDRMRELGIEVQK